MVQSSAAVVSEPQRRRPSGRTEAFDVSFSSRIAAKDLDWLNEEAERIGVSKGDVVRILIRRAMRQQGALP